MWLVASKESSAEDALFMLPAEHFPGAGGPALARDPLVSSSRYPPLWSAVKTEQNARVTALQSPSAMAGRPA